MLKVRESVLPPISFQEKIKTGLSHIKLDHSANKHTGDFTAMNEAVLYTLNIHKMDKGIHMVLWELSDFCLSQALNEMEEEELPLNVQSISKRERKKKGQKA